MARLPFEDPDPSFIPLAGRRALDHAGLKLSLRAWQSLSLLVRDTVARLGEGDEVDGARVRELLEGVAPEPSTIEPLADPPADMVPAEVSDALGGARALDARRWRGLSPVARYALFSYARRGRAEKLAEAYDSLFGGSLSGERS